MSQSQLFSTTSVFADFALRAACMYMGFGGPSGRIEAALKEASKSLELRSEVMASPSGVHLSISALDGSELHTEIRRVRDQGLNLTRIEKLERILVDLKDKRLNLAEALAALRDLEVARVGFSRALRYAAAFVLGASLYAFKVEIWPGALIAGLLTLMVAYVSGPLAKKLHFFGIFGDFVSTLLFMSAAVFFSYWLGLPFNFLIIGALILIVPGLHIITAVSEFSTYNYLSGTGKIMKSLTVLFALVVGFSLVEAVVHLMGRQGFEFSIPDMRQPSPLRAVLQNMVGALAFLIIFQVPKKAFLGALICGLAALGTLYLFPEDSRPVIRYFSASFVVGTLSLIFGHLQKLPSQCFSVPGLYSLLPGLMALSVLSHLLGGGLVADGINTGPSGLGGNIFVLSIAIVFGLIMARTHFYSYSTFKEEDDSDGPDHG